MKTHLVRCMTMLAIAFWVSSAAAKPIDGNFGDSSGDDSTNRVLFSFTNDGRADHLAAIFIHDKRLLAKIVNLFEGAGINFATRTRQYPNMSGDAPSGFFADNVARFGQNTPDGTDRHEFFGSAFNQDSGVTLANFSDRYHAYFPTFRPNYPLDGSPGGLPVGPTADILPQDTNPVPEPTSLVLFGIGTAGLAGLSRRRRTKR